MGTIDYKWFKFTCPTCGKSETIEKRDKGSVSGFDWGAVMDTKLFTVTSSGGGSVEPEVESAVCNECQVNAKVEFDYGQKRPEGF